MTAICTGTFDPITMGHMDIIGRSSRIFDRVIVCIMSNGEKASAFSAYERMDMVSRAVAQFPNVEVEEFSGLLIDYMHMKNATLLVRGIRGVTDFEYECMLEQVYRNQDESIETVYLAARPEYKFLSSSVVRQVAHYGGDVSAFVPACIRDEVILKLKQR
jgi:pantetheine-phosphate adenylyltransferase